MSEGAHKQGFLATELGQRIISAIVMLVIVLVISWMGGWPFAILSTLLSLLLYYEWQAMVRQTPFDGPEALLSAGFCLLLVVNLLGYLAVGLICFVMLGLLLELSTRGNEKSDIRWIGLGALYCSIPAIAFPIIRDGGGFALILFVFVVVWVTDIAAYFAGRYFGGAKLWPAISPKKTWSGAIGGLVFACLAAAVFCLFHTAIPMPEAIVAAAVLSIVSQLGDLFESWVKRLFAVKDSSQLIPGHGGFLDRLDGLVAAAVPMAILVALEAGQF